MEAKKQKTLTEYRNEIKRKTCSCGYPALDKLAIEYYPHTGGWVVHGFPLLQWLYVTCPDCCYQWALWKLGVKR